MIFLENDIEPTTEINNIEKINLDDLFIQKQKKQVKQINTYNKIINKINDKIKFISKRSKNNNYLWYNVPLIVLGYTDYNPNDCIAYIIIKLEENGFSIQFIPPNTLFISWCHWVPSYVRNEIKKRTGILIDNNGNQIKIVDDKKPLDNLLMTNNKENDNKKDNKKYNPIIPY